MNKENLEQGERCSARPKESTKLLPVKGCPSEESVEPVTQDATKSVWFSPMKMFSAGDCEMLTHELNVDPTKRTNNGELKSSSSSIQDSELSETLERELTKAEPEGNAEIADCDDENGLNLLCLPSELLLQICSFLDAKFVIQTVGAVCGALHTIVSDDTFWKVRLGKRWPLHKYPALPANSTSEFCWQDACLKREEHVRVWRQPSDTTASFKFTQGLYAAVDTVHLMKRGRFLASGSRDRYLCLLDLSKINTEFGDANDEASLKECQVFSQMNAHKGWLWSIKSYDDTVVTCSWDTHVKFWDYGSATVQEVQDIKLESALLSCHAERNFLSVGSFNKKIYHIDPRTGQVIRKESYHKAPVLAMVADDRYIVTGSEDSTLVVYDRAASKVLTSIPMTHYPLCLSLSADQLWCGDKGGNVHVFNPADLSIRESFENVHEGKVMGITHNKGAVFTCSSDKTIKVWQPTKPLAHINTIRVHNMDIAEVDYQNGVLASAGSDISVGVWIPNNYVFDV